MAETSTLDKFLAFAAPSSFQALQNYNDNQTASEDLAKFQQDPTYRIDLTKYKVPANAVALDTHLKGLRDFAQQEQANPLLDQFQADYSNLAGPDKRFYADPESRQVLLQSGLQEPEANGNPYVRKGLQDFAKQGQLESDLADQFANPNDPNVLARVAANPLAQANHNVIGALQTSQDKALTRADAQAKEGKADTAQQNLSGFESAIAGLTGKSQSPLDLARFAKTGGYDPRGENDIRMAAADYNVPAEAVNKEVDNYRQIMEKTPTGDPYVKNLSSGNATSQQMLQNFVLGGPKAVGAGITNHPKAASTTVNVAGPGGGTSSDLVQAILEGRMAPKDLPKRNGSYNTIMADVLKQNPQFDVNKANANAGFTNNVQVNRSVKLLDSITPMLDELAKNHAALGFGKYPALNAVKRAYLEQTGDGRVTAYDNLRNNIILEVTNAMSGSGQMSDSRVKMEVENLAKAQSTAQMDSAIANIKKIIGARKDAFQAPVYQQGGGATTNLQSAAAAELARRKGGR